MNYQVIVLWAVCSLFCFTVVADEGEVKPLSRFEAKEPVAAVFSADCSELFVVETGFSRKFRRFETKSGRLISEIPLDMPCEWITFSDDRKQALVSGPYGEVDLWTFDAAKKNPFVAKRRLGEFVYGIRGLAFSPNGKLLATGGEDRTLRFWDATTGDVIAQRQLLNHVDSVAFSSDGKQLLAVCTDGVYTFILPDLESTVRLRREIEEVQYRGGAFAKSGKEVFAWQDDTIVERWRLADGKMIGRIESTFESVSISDVALPPKRDRTFVALGFGGLVQYMNDANTPSAVIQKPRRLGSLGKLLIGNDNRHLGIMNATGGTIWDLGRAASAK